MATTLGEYLKQVRDLLKAVRETAEAVGDANTPTQEQQDAVEADLDAVEADLARIHDPNVSPSLDPPGAGEVQSPTIPSSRLQTAQDAVTIAEDAYDEESARSNPDYDYIGDRTRTVADVYVPEIRSDFGLT